MIVLIRVMRNEQKIGNNELNMRLRREVICCAPIMHAEGTIKIYYTKVVQFQILMGRVESVT